MVDRYTGEVVEVFSGDDLIVMVDLGVDDLFKRKRIRLHGVDTPNGVGQGKSTKAGEIRDYVRRLCRGKKVCVQVITEGVRNWVAVVEIPGPGEPYNLNDDLISKGFKFKREKQNGTQN